MSQPPGDEAPPGGIVVGLDDSESSRTALAWAADQARRTGWALHALHVDDATLVPTTRPRWPPSGPAGSPVATPAHRLRLEQVYAALDPAPGWTLEIVTGDPRDRLVERSTQADLLVVGTRTHLGWGRLRSGSVSHHCVNQARCPTVCVPGDDVGEGAGARRASATGDAG